MNLTNYAKKEISKHHDESSHCVESGQDLLKRLLFERREKWKGKSKYKEPILPDITGFPKLPKTWTWATLESLTLHIGDVDHRMPKAISDGIPYVSTKDFQADNEINYEFAKRISLSDFESLARKVKPEFGDILLSRYGTVGEVRLVKEKKPFQASYSIAILKTHPYPELNSFLLYALRSEVLQEQVRRDVRASAQPDLGLAFIRRFIVPLPPLLEQRRIVAEIEKQFTRLEAGLGALRRVQTNLKRYRAAVLKAACEGRLVPTEAELHQKQKSKTSKLVSGKEILERILSERRLNWKGRGKYKDLGSLENVNLPDLPTGWTWATVEQLAAPEPNSITDGPFGSNLKTVHYTENGPRVIRLQNIGDGFYVDEEAHISPEHFERLQKHRVFPGDVIIAGFGENPPRSCILPESLGLAIVKADCIRFKPNEAVLPGYMNVVLNSDPVRKRTKGMVHGVGRPRLNLREIKSIPLPLPPYAEQKRIVVEVERLFGVVDELNTMISANLQRASRLRKSILQKAFSGNLK